MKRITFILCCFLSLFNVKAQIARWLIPPSYERMQIVKSVDAIMTDSAGVKAVWTMEGKRLLTCKDALFPFKDGIALAVKPGTSQITMAYKIGRESVNFSGCSVAHNYPYYSNGKVLVKNGEYYRYIDTEGNFQEGQFVTAYPYCNGYAACVTYLNMEKQKNLCHFLMDEAGTPVVFTYQGKAFDNEDVQFISSVNDENIGIVVVKSKVYFFNGVSKELTPVFAKDAPSTNVKEQVKLISDIEQSFVQSSDSTYVLYAKYGKNDAVAVFFDALKRPVSIKRNDNEHFYRQNTIAEKTYQSDLITTREGDRFGLSRNDAGEMLPPQFDEVVTCFDSRALVKLNGKYGMLQIMKDANFKLRMNKGDDIAFRHQKLETSVRADFPTFLPAEKVNIEINPQTGCNIDKTSKVCKNTDDGNYVEYNCVLNIPSNLPDELTDVEYPVAISYDGFTSSKIQFKVKAWHYKYFVVDIDDSQTAIENGTVSFVFNINAERIASDGIYPTTVNLQTDSLQYEYEKMSEIRHKCKVYSLKEGVNNIVIEIKEQGCPSAVFPFEVEYHKPVAKTKNKPAEKEKVTIKKKEKAAKPLNVAKPVNHETVRPRVIM